MLICINSSNRWDKQITLSQLSDSALEKTVLAISKEQKEQYKKYKVKKLLIPKKHKDLSSQRQYVMEYVYANMGGTNHVFFMDDDLTFLKRNSDMKLRKCSKKHVDKMIARVADELKEFPMVGVSTRLGNNRVKENHADITRVTRCYALSVDTFFEVGATFSPFPYFNSQDFYITLCWLKAGKPNRVIYDYAQSDIGSNAEGGVSIYRNFETQKKSAQFISSQHPEAKLKIKKSKSSWKGMETRYDLVIQWKKAYKPKQTKIDKGWL